MQAYGSCVSCTYISMKSKPIEMCAKQTISISIGDYGHSQDAD